MRKKLNKIVAVSSLVAMISFPLIFTSCLGSLKTSGSLVIDKNLVDKLDVNDKEILDGKIVFVDAGHGGKDPGTNIGNLYEKDLTLDISIKLKKDLEKNGAKVIMIREDDSFHSFLNRTSLVNKYILERERQRVSKRYGSYLKFLEPDSDIEALKNSDEELENPLSNAILDIDNKLKLVNEYITDPEKSERVGIFTKTTVLNEFGITASKEIKEILDITRESYEGNMIYISVHINYYDTKSGDQTVASGVQVYYRDNGAAKYKENMNYYKNFNEKLRKNLALSILEQMNDTTKFSQKWSEIYREDYGVLRETNLPSVLVEAGFLNNPDDRRILSKESEREKIAEGIQRGVIKYFKEIDTPIK